MRPAKLAVSVILVATAFAAGCHEPQSDSKALPSAALPPSASPPASAGARPPMRKEFDSSPPERLGKLPADIGIPVGQPVPDAAVHDAEGQEVKLGDLINKGPILLVFYRGGWCPYCNFQIHELSQAYPEYVKRGITPVAVSVDKQDEAAKTKALYMIPFPVLSDPDLAAHKAFRVLHAADDAEVAKLKSFGIDLEKSSGRAHHTIAIPAVFLIDRSGVVRWAHADPEYKIRPRTPQILAAIDAVGLKAP